MLLTPFNILTYSWQAQ